MTKTSRVNRNAPSRGNGQPFDLQRSSILDNFAIFKPKF